MMGASELVELERQLPSELAGIVEVIACSCLGACHNRQYGSSPYVRINETKLISEATVQTVTEYLLQEIGENG